MKAKNQSPEITNVFEVALHEAFRKLQIGEPNKKVRKAIDKASRKVTQEVKGFMKDIQKKEVKRIKQERKKLKQARNKKTATPARQSIRRKIDHDIVQDIVA